MSSTNMRKLNTVTRASIMCCAITLLRGTAGLYIYPSHPYHLSLQCLRLNQLAVRSFHSPTRLKAAPKRGSIVDLYQTVSVNCNSCRTRLFRYKKKNGTKSNLIKCYVERIVEAEDENLQRQVENFSGLDENHQWCCPGCGVNFARGSMIRGLPALKLVGGKTRMTKK